MAHEAERVEAVVVGDDEDDVVGIGFPECAKHGDGRGLRCLKSTGDGYLLAFHDPKSAEMSAVRAIEAMFELLYHVSRRNNELPEERALNLRCAVHLGEVDVVANDREGPHVSLAFRLQDISRASLPNALNPIAPEQFPLRDYVLCSEEVAGILTRRDKRWKTLSIGLLKLKGFPGWREIFQVVPRPDAAKGEAPQAA